MSLLCHAGWERGGGGGGFTLNDVVKSNGVQDCALSCKFMV